jgi:Beta-propeller repeat
MTFSRGCLAGVLLAGLACARAPGSSFEAGARRYSDVNIRLLPLHPREVTAQHARVDERYGTLPLTFEANVGQTDPRVDFVSRGNGYALFLTAGEAVLAFRPRLAADRKDDRTSEPVAGEALRIQLVGANAASKAIGRDQLPGKANYLIGSDPGRWLIDIPTYERVAFPDVYPGVDLVYYGNHRELEYDFVLRPGARPQSIALNIRGSESMEVDAHGDLVLRTAGGIIRQRAPVIYQEIDRRRHEIAGRYVLRGAHEIGFDVAAYDSSRPLVIDPVLVYSTYLGGHGGEGGLIAVDGAGNAYLAGSTQSDDFPTTTGAFDTSFNGGGDRLGRLYDVFVTKLDASGSSLLYSTYLGGSHGADFSSGIAIDVAGRVYLAGQTFSDDFPTTPGAFNQTFNGGVTNAFVSKLNETGSALIYSTYLGAGNAADDIAVDAAGSAYVTGVTGPGLPTTPGAFDTSSNDGADAFVTKLDATGSALIYSTYLGGSRCDDDATGTSSGGDVGFGIAIDSAGNAYVTGSTGSTDFPTTTNAFDATLGEPHNCTGQEDAFVTKLDATGSVLLFSTYLGGSGDFLESGTEIAVDAAGSAYVTGTTNSADFPTTPGAFDRLPRSSMNAFVAKLHPTGSALLYSTRLGGTGSGFDIGFGIVVEPGGGAWVTGRTSGADFPTTPDAFDTVIGSGLDTDAFATRLNATGTALIYSTYLGSSAPDGGGGIAVDSTGHVYVAGNTASADFPITPGAFETTYNGGGPPSAGDAFVVKITFPADTTSPATTLSRKPSMLWPPNGKLVPVDISGRMTDDLSGIDAPTAAFHVIDEYGLVQPAGPIVVEPDGSYSARVLLEASRRGRDRDGRRYEVFVSVADKAGNIGSASEVIRVGHDQSGR